MDAHVTRVTRKALLSDFCDDCGLYFRTWSPGDGVTRFRFFNDADKRNDYFGPDDGIATCRGVGDAERWARAYAAGYGAGRYASMGLAPW